MVRDVTVRPLTMQAAVLNRVPGKLDIMEIRTTPIRASEVLVRVSASGLCHSDLHFMEGKLAVALPAVLGHEAAGVVEEVGSEVTLVRAGDHVVSAPSVYCGICEQCLSGRPTLCDDRASLQRPRDDRQRLETLEGRPITQSSNLSAFAEFMLVHENALVKIRDEMPLDRAALLGCGVTTGLGAVFNTAKVEPGTTVAVIGCGGVGLSAVQGARIAGAGRIIAVDLTRSKLDLAMKMGATDTVDASKVEPVKRVRELTGGSGVDYALEAVGLKKTAEQAFSMLKKGGYEILIGMIPMDQEIEVPAHDLLFERRLQATTLGSTSYRLDIPRFVDLYMQRRLNLDDMISKRLRLDEINEGYAAVKNGTVVRDLVVFS